jgi:hypothetical protein
MSMSAASSTYGQSINDHYETIISRHIERRNELPVTGWNKVLLRLPPTALWVDDPKEQDELMEELLRLIREQCSKTNPNKVHEQGMIVDLDGAEIVKKYLRGLKAMLYPGEPVSPVWIEAGPVAGPR